MPQRLAFLAGEISVPEDFDQMTCEGITLVTAHAQLAEYPGPVRRVRAGRQARPMSHPLDLGRSG